MRLGGATSSAAVFKLRYSNNTQQHSMQVAPCIVKASTQGKVQCRSMQGESTAVSAACSAIGSAIVSGIVSTIVKCHRQVPCYMWGAYLEGKGALVVGPGVTDCVIHTVDVAGPD